MHHDRPLVVLLITGAAVVLTAGMLLAITAVMLRPLASEGDHV